MDGALTCGFIDHGRTLRLFPPHVRRAAEVRDGGCVFTGCSAPTWWCDVHHLLAWIDGGATDLDNAALLCERHHTKAHHGFRVERQPDGRWRTWRPDGTEILTGPPAHRANASSEVEFEGTTAWLVGEPGRGVPTIIEMVNTTRLDCVLGSAATVRAALTQAVHHARHRRAFGALLVDQPLMQNVLADLAVESEAATALAVRLAAAVDAGESDFLRLAGAAAEFWVCKRTPTAVAEALEVLGGNGYVEESVMPRLYRQAPLNSIWEGSGNVIALDVLRAMGRSSASLAAVRAEIDLARGGDDRLDAAVGRLATELADPEQLPGRARRIAGLLALCLQASLLLRHAPAEVADTFCATRLAGDWGAVVGTLPAETPVRAIVERSSVPPA